MASGRSTQAPPHLSGPSLQTRRRRHRKDELREPRRDLQPWSGPPTTPNRLDADAASCHRRPWSRRSSTIGLAQMDQMISDDQIDLETYGVSELRDGFFDATFVKPPPLPSPDVLEHCKDTLPVELLKPSVLNARHFLPSQWHQLRSILGRLATTRAGFLLLKSFAAFFIAYVLCLVPRVRSWLGPYHYIMVVSVILNHPARPFGAQVDGMLFTILGAACGLGWGTVGLLLSTSTLAAQAGYGGILALFLALFISFVALMRAFFIRFHQGVMSAGIAIIFTTLAQTGHRVISWPKLLEYAIPWLLGQAIALAVNCLVCPDGGSRALAVTLHTSLAVMQEAVVLQGHRDHRLRRRLARAFVDLSQASRDMALDMTVTRFPPDDVVMLRNFLQAMIRILLTFEPDTCLLEEPNHERAFEIAVESPASGTPDVLESAQQGPNDNHEASRRAIEELREPTKYMLSCMGQALQACDAALMDQSGHRRSLGPSSDISSSIDLPLSNLGQAKSAFDKTESELLASRKQLSESSLLDDQVVRLFVFARHVREATAAVETMALKVQEMQASCGRLRLRLPSYPLWKALHRTNAQVRHDRGGVTAGSYHVTFAEIANLLDKIKSSEHKPMLPRRGSGVDEEDDEAERLGLKVQSSHATMDPNTDTGTSTPKRSRLRYRVWRFLHRLQGFESRYAFKVCLVTALLSVPGYLDQSKGWWDEYEVWWVVAIGWLALHPRVGGNLQDLVTRGLLAILGAAWSGAAYAAGDGNPYVMGAFAAVYMLPMLYRFTQSTHPRSGLVGCLSFTVISLGLQANHDAGTSPALLAVLKGLSFFVGVTAPVVVNWVLWPFVARHELRQAISSMMFFMSIIYRSVVARYVYFDEGKEPTPSDIQRSEMREGRLREGFVRIRQLLVLTQKEMRLRAPFDPVPYSALADACERFLDYLVAVRQSALFYNPDYIRDNPVAAEQLLGFRRDAVATILGNLYVLAGALRSRRKVPRYMPSAAAARKRLLVKSADVDALTSRQAREYTQRTDADADADVNTDVNADASADADAQDARNGAWHQRWGDIYRYSYNASLTGCVAQMEELEKFTKIIVGEQQGDVLKW